MTELVKWTSSAAVLLDFANIFGPMYLLHSLQVAIVTGKSKKHPAIDCNCQMDFKCSSLTILSNIFGPMYLLNSLQVAIVMGKSKKYAAFF